jgi:zinc metalloprotease ZmpA
MQRNRRVTSLWYVVALAIGGSGCAPAPRETERADERLEADRLEARIAAARGAIARAGEWRLVRVHATALGVTHTAFQRYVDGLPVYAGLVRVPVERDGLLPTPIHARVRIEPEGPARLALTSDEAVAIALAHPPAGAPPLTLVSADALWFPSGGTRYGARREVPARATWRVILGARSRSRPARYAVYVDGETGRVIQTDDRMLRASDTTGHSYFYGTIPLRTTASDSPATWLARDDFGHEVVRSVDGSDLVYDDPNDVWGDGSNFKPPSKELTTDPTQSEKTAVAEASFVATQVHQMFQTFFGLDGPDGHGGSVHVNIHNAFDGAFTPAGEYTVYMGRWTDGIIDVPATMIDTIGHEIGHVFFGAAIGDINIPIAGPGAGLNESTGDIVGVLAESYAKQRLAFGVPPTQLDSYYDFLLGQDSGVASLDMACPAHFVNVSAITDTQPPHEAAEPVDHMFAWLVKGIVVFGPLVDACRGSPTLPNGLVGIGLEKAGSIWIEAIHDWLPAEPNYDSAREAALQAAAHQFGAYSTEYKAVQDAFCAIKVGDPAQRRPPDVIVQVTSDHATQVVTVHVESTVYGASDRVADLFIDDQFKYASVAAVFDKTFTYAELGTGTHTITVKVHDAELNQTVETRQVVIDVTGPIIDSAADVGPHNQPRIAITCHDPSGIAKAFVIVNPTLTIDRTAAPYTIDVDTTGWVDGDYTFSVGCEDTAGNRTAQPLTVAIDRTPPAIGAIGISGAQPPFGLTVDATDNRAMDRVLFQVDGTQFASDQAAPFTASYTPPSPGAHTLHLIARDGFGNETTRDLAAPVDTVTPTVSLTATQPGYFVRLVGDVSDPSGLIFPYTVSIDSIVAGHPSAAHFDVSVSTSQLAPGLHTAHVDVSDACGNMRHYTKGVVVNGTPPSMTITIDSTNKKHPIVKVAASDDQGVGFVDFTVRGTSQHLTDASAPYQMTVDTTTITSDGQQAVDIVAADVYGFTLTDTAYVLVDNTPPTAVLHITSGVGLGPYYATATATDTNGLASKKMCVYSGILQIACATVTGAPPWYYTYTASGATNPLRFTLETTDTFGNVAIAKECVAASSSSPGTPYACPF